MICPKCSKKMIVIETRSPGKGEDYPSVRCFLKDGYDVFGWWCHDFDIRLRKCPKCGARLKTIEVSIDDLRDAFDDIKKSRPFGRPWKPGDVLPRLDDSEKPKLSDNWRTQSNLCQ